MEPKTKQKEKSHRRLWIILGVIAVLFIGLIAWGVHAVKNMAEAMTEAMSSNTETVQKGLIEVITEGTGVVETADAHSRNVDYNVTLSRLYKENGEAVKAGEVIAEFQGAALEESISALEQELDSLDSQLRYTTKEESSTVTAPVSGRVKRIFAAEGDSVLAVQHEHQALAEISADGKLKVEFETEGAAVGQSVTIGYGEERLEGEIVNLKGNTATAAFSDGENYTLDTEVTIFNAEDVQIGTGKVASSHPVYVTAESGTVKSISVNENAKVSAGSSIFKLENTGYSSSYLALLEQREQLAQKVETAKEYRKGYVLMAENDGIVSELTAKEGDIIPAGTLFCKLLDTNAYQVVLAIDELDIQGIEPGQQVEVTIDAMGDTVYEGEVSRVSMTGENENGVASYQVTVLLKNAEGLLPGMSANGKITVDTNKNALLVPIDAIQTIDGEKSVTVVKEDGTTEKRKVTIGLVNNENAEILEGVSEGEQVQVIVKLSDIYSQMGISLEGTELE